VETEGKGNRKILHGASINKPGKVGGIETSCPIDEES
jgi:hypothetical protein